ncbi:EAL domain-containing protein [Anianabacter salinae]|uniref:EAL domain-containing protein n=1 Tax=Anianabacter salinae TaxID=2851023 RepID=UPI00225E3283|nr:EAL domain-containing protein [Anianabacter salinae]MBV0913240.1 EAL domain-containing protein [Anianabacter salinae]
MKRPRRWNDTEVPDGLASPLDAAIRSRDAATMQMVRRAIDSRDVLLAFQPVMQAARPDRPAFYEGLLRVLDPTGRVIPARDFIGAVEETETGRQLDCLALDIGLRTLAEQPWLRLAVNMSARSIGYPPWMRTLNHGLSADPTVGERLILEITESSAMLMPDIVQVFMADLQTRGIAFALDDFGAGYTSFRYLRDFYFDIIKIDGQFIGGIATTPDNQVLTRALISIAQHFDMFTVAEAVERPEDADFLIAAGIDCLQGYLYAAPTVHPHWAKTRALGTG